MVVALVESKNEDAMLALAALGPLFMSADTNVGTKEVEAWFPPSIDHDYFEIDYWAPPPPVQPEFLIDEEGKKEQ